MQPSMSLARKAETTRPGTSRRGACLFLCVLGLLFVCGRVSVWGATVSESEVKAAFLYNFAKFVEWPAQAFSSETAPIQVAVLGDEEFTAKLKTLLSDKKAHGRSFDVKRIMNPQEAKTCQIVFVPASESRRAFPVIEATRKLPILTVGESDQFIALGGMINFVFEDNQLRFEINPEPAETAKLQISSKLLRLGIKRSPK
jgi:hypothetical protein